MMLKTSVRALLLLSALFAPMLAPRPAAAQGVGAGPLTGALTDTEPLTGVLSFARIRFAPGIVVREIGWDNNVFDEFENPKEDFIMSAMPDVSAFTRLRFVQVSAYAGLDLNYFRTYSDESSVGQATRARVDVLLSRVKPFFGAGHSKMRTRPNGEIDVRADRGERELSGGIGFDLSATSSIFAAGGIYENEFSDAFEEGVDLSRALNRRTTSYSGGLRTALTPLLTMTLSGSYSEDDFVAAPLRNSESYSMTAALRFGAEAIVTGSVNAAYREFRPVDPSINRFRGLVGQAALSYSFLEVGRLTLTGSRSVEYSFDELEGYYIENTFHLGYTHRLFGDVDAQVRGGRSYFDYGHRATTPAHVDTLDTLGTSFGYNLPNRTRIAVNYEYSRRRSPALAERNYDKRRVYLAWSYAF